MATEFLRTNRVFLREFTPDDVGYLVELDSDPEVMRHLTGGVATSADEIRSRVLPRIVAEYRLGTPARWAAHAVADGEFLGWFALDVHHSPSPDRRELGYRLRRSAWGTGLATEVSRALVDAAFERFDASLVWAETMAVNAASRRVLTKAGLRHVRTEHRQFDDPLPGADLGEVVYELTYDEWRLSGT